MSHFFTTMTLILSSSFLFAQDRIDDGNLFGIINEIENTLIQHEHSDAQLRKAHKLLEKVFNALEPASGHALLVISGADPFDFGLKAAGSSSSQIFTIVNSGNKQASSISQTGLNKPFSFTGGFFPGTGGDCGTTLDSGAACTIGVEFTPATTGVMAGTISIQYDNGYSMVTSSKTLMGTGTVPANIIISETNPYDFGSVIVGETQSHIFTIINSGGTSATGLRGSGLFRPFGFTGGSFPGLTGTCSATLSAGASCTIEVAFSPIFGATNSDWLDINYFDGAYVFTSSQHLIGTGVSSGRDYALESTQ